jgi:hypothetical protein
MRLKDVLICGQKGKEGDKASLSKSEPYYFKEKIQSGSEGNR